MRFFIVLLSVLTLLVPFGVQAQIKFPSIKNGLIELALDQISTPGSFEITAESVDDLETGETRLTGIQISDGTGIWLTLEQVVFDWEPSSILSGDLSITKLELIGLSVLRPPSEDAEPPELKPSEPSGRGIFDWPRAPVGLSIEGVRLERVNIAAGVLPQAISFNAQARAYDKGDLQEVALSLTRTDSVAGDIAISMVRDFAANTVKLEISANEAPGGIVAAAGGFPADSPARLELKADGPPEDWRLIFNAVVERVFDAQGRTTLAYADQLMIDADFSVTPGPELAPELRTVLGSKATLRAQVIEQADGVFEIVSGELESPALTLNASGAYATGAGDSNLKVALAALPPFAALADGVTFERFSFDGTVSGPQGGLVAEGRLGLAALATAPLDAGSLELDGRVAQTAGGMTFNLDGKGVGLRIDQLGPDVIGGATLGAAGMLDGDLLTLTRAGLNSRALNTKASGTYDLAASTGNLTAKLSAGDIAPIANAYGTAASGGVAASADVTIAGQDIRAKILTELTGFAMDTIEVRRMTLGGNIQQIADRIAFDMTGGGEGIVLDKIPTNLTQSLDLVARGGMAAGSLDLETLSLVSPLVSLETSGTMALEASTLALEYRVETSELAPVAQAYGANAAGALTATGRADGGFAALRVAGSATIAEAAFDGKSYGAVALSHDLTLGEAIDGGLSLTSDGGVLGPAEVSTQLRLEGVQLTLDALKAQVLGAVISGAAAVDLESSLVDGAVDLTINDLSSIGQFVGTRLGGAVGGRVTLKPADSRQNVDADITLTRFATDGAAIGRANLKLRAADVLGGLVIDLRADASAVDVGGVTLSGLKAQAKGPLSRIGFSVNAEGAVGDEPMNAALAGSVDASGPEIAATLASAEVTAGQDTIRLRQPLALRAGGGSVVAKGLDLALPEEALLTGDLGMRPGGFTGDLTLARLPVSLLERLADAPLTSGILDLTAAFDTRRGSATANVNLRARGIQFAKAQAETGGIDLDTDAVWNGAKLEAKAEIRGDFGDPARASLVLPLRPGADGIPQVPARGEIDGSVNWTGDLGDLWALVPAPGHVLDGRADLDLRLSGTLDVPRVSGKADLSDGVYQNLDAGTILTDLSIRTSIADDGTVNLRLDGDDGAQGKVSSRIALLLGGDVPKIDATVDFKGTTLVRRDDVTASVNGDLALAGVVSDLALTGRITIDKAEVRLVNSIPPEVIDLEGIRINGAPEPEAKDADGGILKMDLRIDAPRNIFVRGRGLESEWKMDLAVTGDAETPRVTGSIEKVRGRLDLLGRPFDLARGRIVFDGAVVIDPLIDVALDLEDNGIRGGIRVEGRASAPELGFASTPALPEEEVLPRLLFGQSKQSMTGAQALQLAAGVATLLGSGAGPLDSVRSAAGLDTLRVDGQDVDDASVTIGRNVAEGVFIGARQGLAGQGSAVTVEVEVFDGVTVDTEFGQDQGSNIGVTLGHDF